MSHARDAGQPVSGGAASESPLSGNELNLRESQRMLANLLANLHGMAYRCRNDEHWTMEFVSEGCRELTGHAAENLLGNHLISYEEIIHPGDRARVRSEVEAALRAGQRFELMYRIITADGAERWVLEHGLAIRSPAGEVCFLEGIVTDITARRRAELALAESEEKFCKSFQTSPEAISISELATGRIIEVNESYQRLSGYSRAELVGRTSEEVGIWTNLDDRKKMVEAVRAHGMARDLEVVARMRDGVLRVFVLGAVPVEIGGRPFLVVQARDITGQRAAERALRESEEKFSKAFRASPYSLTISELATGRYLDVNTGFERLSGYTRAEVIGRTSFELGLWSNPADREELVRRLQRDHAVRDFELTFIGRGGRQVLARCSVEIIEVGGVTCLLNVLEDITGQRDSELARAALEEQLQQSQKLEALGRLAGGIAHDFNGILTGMMAYNELAVEDADKPAAVREHLGELRKACNRAKDLVRQILTFSRQQVRERKPVQLHAIIQEAVDLLRAGLPKNITIEVRADPLAPVVLADPTQIHQIVMNLCTNAAQAMREPPRRLSIGLETVQLDEASCGKLPGLRPGIHALLTVSDTGHGMDAEALRHCFEPFFTTKDPGEGTGLGLAVVHGIVESHDGAITVQSRVGEGTTFRIFFPEHTVLDPAISGFGGEEPLSRLRGAGERILFIDDERMIAHSACGLLGYLGYDVTEHTDPRAALDAFLAHPSGFDLVVTDLTMPRISGLEVVRQVLAARPGLPVLLANTYNPALTSQNLRELGVRGLIVKPLIASELATAVRQALDGMTAPG